MRVNNKTPRAVYSEIRRPVRRVYRLVCGRGASSTTPANFYNERENYSQTHYKANLLLKLYLYFDRRLLAERPRLNCEASDEPLFSQLLCKGGLVFHLPGIRPLTKKTQCSIVEAKTSFRITFLGITAARLLIHE